MNKISKRSMIIMTLLVIVLLVVSRFYIESKISVLNNSIIDNNARKEDLLIKQKQLESQIIELNNTLQAEITKMNNLSNTLEQLKKDPNNQVITQTITSTGSSSSSSSSGSQQQTPAPAP